MSRQPVNMQGRDCRTWAGEGNVDGFLPRTMRSTFLAVGVDMVGPGEVFSLGSRLFMAQLPS